MELIYELAPKNQTPTRAAGQTKAKLLRGPQLELFDNPKMIVHKQTPLQPAEIKLLAAAPNITLAAKQLGLASRPSVPLEIIRAYQTLHNPRDLLVWGQDPKNLALHRLAVEANRSSFIRLQNSTQGSQYSQVVNFWLLAQPKYRQPKLAQEIKPLFHPQLWEAINCWNPQLDLSLDLRRELRCAVLQHNNKPAHQIWKPGIQNHYNLVDLNWVALLELWVCVAELQHPNQLLECLGHQPLDPQPLFENQ